LNGKKIFTNYEKLLFVNLFVGFLSVDHTRLFVQYLPIQIFDDAINRTANN